MPYRESWGPNVWKRPPEMDAEPNGLGEWAMGQEHRKAFHAGGGGKSYIANRAIGAPMAQTRDSPSGSWMQRCLQDGECRARLFRALVWVSMAYTLAGIVLMLLIWRGIVRF